MHLRKFMFYVYLKHGRPMKSCPNADKVKAIPPTFKVIFFIKIKLSIKHIKQTGFFIFLYFKITKET